MDIQEKRLQDEILSEARARSEKILVRVRNDIRRAETRAAADRDKRRQARLAETEAEAAHAIKALEDQVRLEEQRRWLIAREAEIQKVFAAALEQSAALDGPARRETLAVLAAEAIRALGPGDYAVACATADRDTVTPEFLDKIAAGLFPGDDAKCHWDIAASDTLRGGLRFAAADGSRVFDNSLEGRLAHMDRELRSVLLSGLEAGEAGK